MPGIAGPGSTGIAQKSTISRILGDLQDRAMSSLIDETIIYNVSWEDPRLDCEMLNIQEKNKDTILMLTSGGCNVLDMLLERPKEVVGGDLNPRQNALLELKCVCIKVLKYEEFFELFARSNYALFCEVWPRLKPHLGPFASDFWENNKDFFKSVMWSGSSGVAAKLAVTVCRALGLGGMIDGVRDCPTLEAQREVYAKYEPHCRSVCKFFFSLKRFFAPLLGVPANQLDLFDGNIVKHVVDNLFMNTHIAKDNYFYYGYMFGEYSTACCPRYLKKENWAALKELVPRVTIRTGTLKQVANGFPDGYFSRYILLDHMDWMPMSWVLDEWSVFAVKARADCRILWRSYCPTLHIAPLKYLKMHPENVAAALRMHPDRVAMYNSTHLATIPPNVAFLPRVPYAPTPSLKGDLVVLFSNFLHPIRGSDHKARLESFYGLQAGEYDAFRPRFLHGRVPMIEAMPTPKDGVWVDMGGGTGANMEHLKDDITSNFSKVVLLDFTPSLLKEAAARVKRNNWGAVVTTVEGDACVKDQKGMPKAGTVDLVTFSYSLTMIPDWKAAVENAVHLLKPGGYIAVSDFTVTPQHNALTRFLWPFILGQDGVRPSTEHIPYLDARFSQVHLTVDRGGFPYVRELALVVGAVLGALLALSPLGAWVQGVVGPLPSVPVWGALLLAARLLATVALLSASLGAFSLCPTKNMTLRVVKFAFCVALGALAWRLPFAPQLDVVSAGLEAGWAAAAEALPQLGSWSTAARAEVPTWAPGVLGGGIVGLFVNSKLLKAPYYYYVGRKA